MDACNNEHVPQTACHMNGIDNSANAKIIKIMLSVMEKTFLLSPDHLYRKKTDEYIPKRMEKLKAKGYTNPHRRRHDEYYQARA